MCTFICTHCCVQLKANCYLVWEIQEHKTWKIHFERFFKSFIFIFLFAIINGGSYKLKLLILISASLCKHLIFSNKMNCTLKSIRWTISAKLSHQPQILETVVLKKFFLRYAYFENNFEVILYLILFNILSPVHCFNRLCLPHNLISLFNSMYIIYSPTLLLVPKAFQNY